jgi:hypothetical protein
MWLTAQLLLPAAVGIPHHQQQQQHRDLMPNC